MNTPADTRVAVFYDCEFLVDDGAPQRFWNGPRDPDPQVVQIGACRMSLTEPFVISDPFVAYIAPRDRRGDPLPLPPLFTGLTGITQATVDAEGTDYTTAMARFDGFAEGADLWSWGKDELNLIGTGCMVHNVAPPIPLSRFRNACELLLAAGVTYETVTGLRSNTLLAHFGLTDDPSRAHDARSDARQVALVVRHLLLEGRLSPTDVTCRA